MFNSSGEEINLSSFGLFGLKLIIPSPSYRMKSEFLDGRSGELIIEKILNSRSLTAEFFVKASDYLSSLDVRDQLFEVIGGGKTLYVVDLYQPLKRWKVHVDEWTPERINTMVSKFEIPLLVESGMAESVSVIEKNYSVESFRFNNEGNVFIDPRTHLETEIKFTGTSTNLVIRNLTTGDEWSWSGATVVDDTILLKGVRSLKNNASVFGQTNKKLITLAPGWNDFEVVGATGDFELIIRSRFYFL